MFKFPLDFDSYLSIIIPSISTRLRRDSGYALADFARGVGFNNLLDLISHRYIPSDDGYAFHNVVILPFWI